MPAVGKLRVSKLALKKRLPMAIIQSDSLEMSKALKLLVLLCEKSGAQFHPDLTIQYQNFDLSIICKNPNVGRLMLLTEENLLPVNSEHFTLENDHIILKPTADTGWSGLQNDIAHIIFSIFNHSEKIKQIRRNSFWLTMQRKNELCNHILAAKQYDMSDKRFLDVSQNQSQQDQVVLKNFFNSRVLGLSKGGNESQRVIMPVIDYLNHHWGGASYNFPVKNAPILLRVNRAQPVPDSDECFAFYSPMDALDSYIKYGFSDLSAPVVRSAPLDIDIEDIGRIEIVGLIAKTVDYTALQALKNIPRQVPVIDEVVKGSYIRVSHIFIPGSNTPYAMKRVLAGLIQRLSIKVLDESSLRKIIRHCEEQIIETNILYYKKLETLADSQILRELSTSQLSKIDHYVLEIM